MERAEKREPKAESKMENGVIGTVASIQSAIDAVGCARLDWCRHDEVYCKLGKALEELRKAMKKAEKMQRRVERRCAG